MNLLVALNLFLADGINAIEDISPCLMNPAGIAAPLLKSFL
jgi:hypothetical protein